MGGQVVGREVKGRLRNLIIHNLSAITIPQLLATPLTSTMVRRTVYDVQCTVYDIQCTVYIVLGIRYVMRLCLISNVAGVTCLRCYVRCLDNQNHVIQKSPTCYLLHY